MKKRLISLFLILSIMIFSIQIVVADEDVNPDEEVTPVLTETPEITDTPEITEEPTSTPEPEITDTPEVSDTPTPEPQITNTPVPATNTPVPEVSVTKSPSKTPTPVITKKPTPSATPGPTHTPTGTPYATVIPPKNEESYPSPGKSSDKSVESKSPSVVKIDGIYDPVWDLIEPVEIKNVSWGESGASGSFRIYWDKVTLFVLVDVNDNTPDTASDMFSRQDCVEIFINENGTRPLEYGYGDCHFKVNRDGVVEYGKGADDSNVSYKVIPKDNGYMIEAAVTFTSISPIFGQIIGFDVRINDSQGDQYRDYMIQWSDTSMYTYTDLSKVGLLYLK